jgi:hypothetical protein
MSTSRLARQLTDLAAMLRRINARFALVGGLALAPHHVVRSTQDVDLLVDIDRAEDIDGELAKLGYSRIYRSSDVANYSRADERVDLLYASRPIARNLLATARVLPTSLGEISVVGLEGLIAFKLQGVVNDPRRSQDIEDIRALLRANRQIVNLDQLAEYFKLFDREQLLNELLNDIR